MTIDIAKRDLGAVESQIGADGTTAITAEPNRDSPRHPLEELHSSADITSVALKVTALFIVIALPAFVSDDARLPSMRHATPMLGLCLIALATIDLATFRLPDALTLSLVAAGCALSFCFDWSPSFTWRLVGAAAAFFGLWMFAWAYARLRDQQGLGLGDVKLMAAAGAWTGLGGVLPTLLFACAGALLFAGFRFIAGNPLARNEPFPFGPFLATGLWIVWCYELAL